MAGDSAQKTLTIPNNCDGVAELFVMRKPDSQRSDEDVQDGKCHIG